MTNLQEAKLAREAEICYTTIALVTDYDCWHPDHDSVTVDMIIANLDAEREDRAAGDRRRGRAAAVRAHLRVRDRPEARDHHAAGRDPAPRPGSGWRRSSASTFNRLSIPSSLIQHHHMSIIVTGSIAFDYLMSFPGKFTEHFLPEHMTRVSLSFLVDTMDKRRGGCAPNIAYTLALLGERPRLMATAGQDFGDYRQWLEAAGVDTSLVRDVDGQVHGVVLLQHRHRRTIRSPRSTPARWRTPASCRSARRRREDRDHLAERSGRDGAVRGGVPHARHSVHLGSGSAVRADVGRRAGAKASRGASIVICNDYEFELIRQKTGLDGGRDPERRPARWS